MGKGAKSKAATPSGNTLVDKASSLKRWDSPTGWYTHEHRLVKNPKLHRINPLFIAACEEFIPERSTVVDLGAGYTGPYVHALRARGYDCRGLEGTPNCRKATGGMVEEQDLTKDCSHWFGMAAWGLLLNVGEYIPPEYEEALIDNVSLIATDGLIVCWTSEAKRGVKNPMPESYLSNAFGLRGWKQERLENRKLLILRKGV